jgi:hypothetical protein
MTEFKLPTETIELPSKGLLYPSDNPLSSGTIEIKYMTAAHEDILTNQSYIQNGTVLDKLFKSLIVSKINYDDLLIGDKNAIMVAARILGYGKEYTFTYDDREETIDLSQLNPKEVDTSLFNRNNQFDFTFPNSGNKITFKLLTHGDEIKISREIAGLKKIKPDTSSDLSTRLKYMITSVEGDDSPKAIRDFIDNYLLAQDSRAFRAYVNKISPDIDLTFFPQGSEKRVSIPIGLNFFWPDVE